MATSRFVQITDKEINEIRINSILKNTKDPTKFGGKLLAPPIIDLPAPLIGFISYLLRVN